LSPDLALGRVKKEKLFFLVDGRPSSVRSWKVSGVTLLAALRVVARVEGV